MAGVHRNGIVSSVKELEKLSVSALGGTLLAADRFVGYRKALAEADIPYDPSLIFVCDYSHASGQGGGPHFLMRGGVEAVVARQRLHACGLIRSLTGRDTACRRDLSVIGADDVELAALCSPMLTTVRPERRGAGQAGCDRGKPPHPQGSVPGLCGGCGAHRAGVHPAKDGSGIDSKQIEEGEAPPLFPYQDGSFISLPNVHLYSFAKPPSEVSR